MLCQLFLSSVKAGFPSPANDFVDRKLDLNEYLISHPVATYFLRASGDSMEGALIKDGDLLIVDKSADPKNGDIVIASIEGEFTVKTYSNINGVVKLIPANSRYKTITIDSELIVWGVVKHVIHTY